MGLFLTWVGDGLGPGTDPGPGPDPDPEWPWLNAGARVPLGETTAGVSGISGVTTAGNVATVSGTNVTISGRDLRAYAVVINGDGCVIEDCYFSANSLNWALVEQNNGAEFTLRYCTFDSAGAPQATANPLVNAWDCHIHHNVFLDTPEDVMNVGGGLIEANYIARGGYRTGSHADAIWVAASECAECVVIKDNYIDWTKPGAWDDTLTNAIRITSELFDIDGALVQDNVILGGGYTIEVNVKAESITNVVIVDNWVGLGEFGDLYPDGKPGDLVYSNNTHVDSYDEAPPPWEAP